MGLMQLVWLTPVTRWPEQEADLQRHRARLLLGEGRIEEIAACLKPKRQHTFEDSVRAFEVRYMMW